MSEVDPPKEEEDRDTPELALNEEQMESFERALTDRPLSLNLSAQRLLRRKPRWKE